jgi:ribosomal protein S18 acetylase RimI-like enzyme
MIAYQKLETKDYNFFVELIYLFEDVFEMKNFTIPKEEHLKKLLTKESFFIFVALLANKVIGGLTAYTLDQYYSTKPLVYIFDLAVKREFQRRGIGKNLISAINTYCKELGVEEVFVQADLVDDYALDFYRSTGGIQEDVVHFSYPLN